MEGVARVWRPTIWAGPSPSRKSLNWLSGPRRVVGKTNLEERTSLSVRMDGWRNDGWLHGSLQDNGSISSWTDTQGGTIHGGKMKQRNESMCEVGRLDWWAELWAGVDNDKIDSEIDSGTDNGAMMSRLTIAAGTDGLTNTQT